MPLVGVEYGETAVPRYKGSPIVAQKKRTYTPPKPAYQPRTTYTAPKPAVQSYQTVQAPAAPTPAPAPVQAAPKTAIDDYFKRYLGEATNDVNSLYDKQKNARLQQFKAERDAAIGKITQQKRGVQQDFYNKRNEADVVNAQNAQRLREIMAANGITASGENLTMNAQINSDRQNSLNALNQQEQANIQEFEGQITDLNNPSRMQSIESEIESQRSNALLDAKNNAQERAWREYTYQNMSASEKSTLEWAKQQYGEDAAWRMFELQSSQETAKSQTLAELEFYKSGFNNVQGGGDYSKYKISSPFGMRKDPIDGSSKMHNGVDIAMPKGAPVASTVGGTVVYSGFGQKGSGYGGYGNVVVVRDSMGNLHQYSHLDSIGVKAGQKVAGGALIGKAGSTGRSTGPHLDYSVKTSKGQYINPMTYIG